MSGATGSGRSAKADAGLRWAAAVVAVAVSVLALIRLDGRADDGWCGLDRLRDALRGEGYGILGWYFSTVLAAAVTQTPPALRRRARAGAGWLVTAVLVAYGFGVAGLAALLAPYAPQDDPHVSRGDPAGIYGAMLVCMLGGPALLALSGAVFPAGAGAVTRRPTTGRGHDGDAEREGRESAWGALLATALVTALLGTAFLLLLLATIAVARFPAWIPGGGGAFVVIGAVAAGGIGAVAFLAGVLRVTGRRALPDLLRSRGAGAGVLAGTAVGFAVTGLLGAQLGRVLPAVVVRLLALGWLLSAGPALAWIVRRRAAARTAGTGSGG